MPKPKAKAKPKSKAAAAAASKREATKNNNAVSAEKENEMEISDPTSVPIREQCRGGAESMYTIMRHAELKESLHKRYEKELQQLYSRTYSSSPHVRYRICYFVNLILETLGPNAALDDTQCDEIIETMLERVKDVSAGGRKQAVLAMQRLQIPDNPVDPVVCAY
ncbi:uncharacterized protein LOC117189686 isoform X2 [Drosophila miranda]|uniref:uncharacterized protein LOC117189686 isoform X2 n=1 Tax=Drosophila miranda TaxID=7229 RepID=UPI00143F1495|nr:uncharacterized protein LOC117189686 isoform X2 [Drosophila miranda]